MSTRCGLPGGGERGIIKREKGVTTVVTPFPHPASNTPMPAELDLRRSARLIILDPRGRLLLFRYHDEHKPPFWSTAGGELQDGEDYRAAVQRELLEETGF